MQSKAFMKGPLVLSLPRAPIWKKRKQCWTRSALYIALPLTGLTCAWRSKASFGRACSAHVLSFNVTYSDTVALQRLLQFFRFS